MSKYFLIIIIATLFLSCQRESSALAKFPPSSFFPENKTKVLIVGTIHLNYPGSNAHQIKTENKIDILTEPKKSELTELIEYLKKFKPTKIAIEAPQNWQVRELLANYKAKKYVTLRDERVTVGIRLVSELKLDTFYCIDAHSMKLDLTKIDSGYIAQLFKDYDFQNEDTFNLYANNWMAATDSLASKTNLLEYYKYINSPESHQLGYGVYLIGDFKLDSQRGADILASWWYNRNLRILRNIQQIDSEPSDRILVLIGNGHAAVLRQLIQCSPEYEFIEMSEL